MKLYQIAILVAFTSCAVTKSTQSMHTFTGDTTGCGDFTVYKTSEDEKEYISVSINASNLDWQGSQSYGVGVTDIMEVKRKRFETPIAQALCNDTTQGQQVAVLEEIATEGIVEVILNESEIIKAENKESYRVTIVLKKVVFEGVTIDYLRMDNVLVGLMPG